MPKRATGTQVEWSPKHRAWTTRVRLDAEVDGKTVTTRPRIEIVGATSKAHAERLAPAIVDKLKRDGIPKQRNTIGETFAQWAERWLAEREARGLTTLPNDRGYVRNHFAALHALPIATIKREHVEMVVEELDAKVRTADLEKRISSKTVLNAWGTLTKMFADACSSKTKALRVRDDDPTHNVAGPDRGPERSKAFLYPSEFAQLMACEEVDRDFRRMIAVAVYTYTRASELGALEVEDIDLAHGVAHIHRTLVRDGSGTTKELKGKEARRVPIEPALVPLLTVIVAERKTGRLFPAMPRIDKLAGRLRDALTVAEVKRADLYADDATRKNLTWHDLRASGLTWEAVRGTDPLKIQRRAGHKQLSTTQIYIREGESLREGFGTAFPALPKGLIGPLFGPVQCPVWSHLRERTRQ